MKRIHSLIFLLFTVTSFAQKSPAKFGDIPMEDMTMKVYPLDSSASAVILFDYGVAYISTTTTDAYLYFERHTRIKILKKEGLHSADISIPLFHSGSAEEKVSNLKASTYNLDGGKVVEVKLPKDGTLKEKFNKNYNQVKFSLPNVKEGSIIEYSYKITSEFFTNFPNWKFQYSQPVRHSEYWAMIPKFFFFEKYTQGYVPLTTHTANDASYYNQEVTANHYVSKDVPAFHTEPYMTSEDDYVSKINFALSHYQTAGGVTHEVMGSWEKLAELLRSSESFGKAISGSGFLKDEVEKITTGITDPAIKAASITNYVKQNFEWDGDKDFTAFPLRKVFEKKKGSSGDLNILLGSMLDKAGFDVEMILLSTRDHGFIRQSFPMQRQFNYTVCSVKAGDKTLFLDATEKYLPYDVLPAICLNGQGLKIAKSTISWIDIQSKVKEKTFIGAEFALKDGATLDGKISYSCDGYDAQEMRENYFSKGEEVYSKEFMANKQWTVVKNEFKDMKDFDKSAKAVYEINIEEHATSSGDVIYINPFVTQRIEENPFKAEKREYPVDYGSKIEKIYTCKIAIPEGFTVDELPKSKVVAMPESGARYTYNVAVLNNAISITSNFQINKTLFVQNEYPLLREFYNQIIAKQAEQIVLKKN